MVGTIHELARVGSVPVDWEALKAEIASALGRSPETVPRPGTPDFFALHGQLQDSHPELAHKIQAFLAESVHTQPLPSEAAILGEARRARLRRGLLTPFTKPDPTQPPRRRYNKALVFASLMAAVIALWAIGRMHSTPLPVPSPPHRLGAAAPASHPGQREPGGGPTTGAAPSGGTRAPGTALAPPPLPPVPGGFPAPSAPPPGTRPGAPSGAGGSPGQAGQTGNITIVAPSQPESKLAVVGPKDTPSATTVVAAAAPAAGGPSAQSRQGGVTVVSAASPSTSGGPAGVAPEGQPAATRPTFNVGDQFTVKLLTPLAVSPAWEAVPAVAQVVDGSLSGWRLIGTAAMGRDGSLNVNWNQALSPDGKTTIQIHGVAYDPAGGKPGVPAAQTGVMAPQAARTALSGTLGAVSQYVQDQIQAQQAQIVGLTASLTIQVPPFWQVLAQQLATGFQPAPVQTGGTVMVARLPAGAPIVVFITAPS